MGFLSVLSFVQQLVNQRVQPGDDVVDATLGNGIDASFLAKLVGTKGRLYGFDIQPEAIQATQKRLEQDSLTHVPCQLFLQSHEHMLQCLPTKAHGNIAAVMFNLGYLPGGSSEIITTPGSTIKALQAATAVLRVHGLVTIVLYPGHHGGETECRVVEQWAGNLPAEQFQVIQYRFANRQPHAPYCIAIEKSKAGGSAIKPYPLKFKPEMKERVWGGRALEQFGFDMPEGKIGEAWILSEHSNGKTTVTNGPLAGLSLTTVSKIVGNTWFGKQTNASATERFPLLVKLLDCHEDLSVQVHPSDDYMGLPAGEQGKTEMWYVLDAKPGAQIVFGLKENVSREDFIRAIEEDRIMETLNVMDVKKGDAFFIPAGTVHALGRGVLIAEIQQNSDTTYRLYDYKRPGLDGKLRELHIEDSLNVIAFQNEGATHKSTSSSPTKQWQELARSPYFVVEKGTVNALETWDLSMPEESYVIHLIGEGSGTIVWEHGECKIHAGEAVLLPANIGTYVITAHENVTILRCYLP